MLKKEKTMLQKVATKCRDFRTIVAFLSIGQKDYTWVVSKKGTTEEQNDRIEKKLQDIAEAEYGNRELAFVTKVHVGPGCNVKRKDGAKLFVIIPPSYYDEGKRLKGWSSTFKKLVEWMGINEYKKQRIKK